MSEKQDSPLGILPVGGLRGEFKIQAMYVETLSEGSRTRVRFPPPPPISKAKAPIILGLLLFEMQKYTVWASQKKI